MSEKQIFIKRSYFMTFIHLLPAMFVAVAIVVCFTIESVLVSPFLISSPFLIFHTYWTVATPYLVFDDVLLRVNSSILKKNHIRFENIIKVNVTAKTMDVYHKNGTCIVVKLREIRVSREELLAVFSPKLPVACEVIA